MEIKEKLNRRFRIKDLGKVKQYLGIDIEHNPVEKKMYLSQEKYIKSLAEKFNDTNSKRFDTPMELNLKLKPADKVDDMLKYRNLMELCYISQITLVQIYYFLLII